MSTKRYIETDDSDGSDDDSYKRARYDDERAAVSFLDVCEVVAEFGAAVFDVLRHQGDARAHDALQGTCRLLRSIGFPLSFDTVTVQVFRDINHQHSWHDAALPTCVGDQLIAPASGLSLLTKHKAYLAQVSTVIVDHFVGLELCYDPEFLDALPLSNCAWATLFPNAKTVCWKNTFFPDKYTRTSCAITLSPGVRTLVIDKQTHQYRSIDLEQYTNLTTIVIAIHTSPQWHWFEIKALPASWRDDDGTPRRLDIVFCGKGHSPWCVAHPNENVVWKCIYDMAKSYPHVEITLVDMHLAGLCGRCRREVASYVGLWPPARSAEATQTLISDPAWAAYLFRDLDASHRPEAVDVPPPDGKIAFMTLDAYKAHRAEEWGVLEAAARYTF